MIQPTQGRRLAGRLLIGGAALALPLTATITYAAGEPEPAAPSAPPAAPTWDAKEVQIDADTATEPGKPGRIHKIVVVEKGEGDVELSTRTITRGNRTYVFKTTKPLSDAEVDAIIARATVNRVPPFATENGVVTGSSGQRVVIGGTVQRGHHVAPTSKGGAAGTLRDAAIVARPVTGGVSYRSRMPPDRLLLVYPMLWIRRVTIK